jgi:serine/threonine-protein kinase
VLTPAAQALEFGRYRVVEEVARRAEGVVYKARDPIIDRLVLVKTIEVGLSSAEYEGWRRRVDRELKSAGRLNHPNIVTIYDVGTQGDIAYLATEYLDGRTLRDLLDAGVTLLPGRAADIAAQVADGLAFIHQRGIVHRDIKPDNLMLLRGGGVKITDFGIARLSRGSHTQIAEVVASPRYTSPEQVTGESIDERSDIFSLGAVLYEMLSGAPPFAGGRLYEIAQQIVNEMPPAPSTRNRNVSFALDAIVAKALAKRPGDRYRNAREMAAELRMISRAAYPGGDDATAVAAAPEAPQPGVDDADVTSRSGADVKHLDAPSGGPPVVQVVEHRRRGRALLPFALSALVLVGAAAWVRLGPWTPLPVPAGARVDATSGGEVATAPAAIAGLQAEALAPAAATYAASSALPASTPLVKESPVAGAKGTIRLALAISPWGEVYVDGQRKGVSPPLAEINLAPGTYTIEIRNTTFRPFRERFDLRNATDVKIKHKFQ